MKLRLLLLPLLLGALALTAATPQTAITVTVKDEFDKPIDNAAVILDFLGSHQIAKLGKRKATHWEVHTNQEGLAHFPPVPKGKMQIQVVAKNHQTFGKRFEGGGAYADLLAHRFDRAKRQLGFAGRETLDASQFRVPGRAAQLSLL